MNVNLSNVTIDSISVSGMINDWNSTFTTSGTTSGEISYYSIDWPIVFPATTSKPQPEVEEVNHRLIRLED